MYATIGDSGKLFCFLGHTDVVPTGPEELWTHPPFSGKKVDGNIFASGANRKIYVGESGGAGGTFGHIGWNDSSNYLK